MLRIMAAGKKRVQWRGLEELEVEPAVAGSGRRRARAKGGGGGQQ